MKIPYVNNDSYIVKILHVNNDSYSVKIPYVNNDSYIVKIPYVGSISYTFKNKLKQLFWEELRVDILPVFNSFKVQTISHSSLEHLRLCC